MMQALGIVEVVGLVAAIEAADVACKTADVRLVGYERAKGGGYLTIKVEGQVGAVNAAVAAASAAASKITRVVSALVIPRPHDQLDPMVFNSETVGYQGEAAGKPAEQPKPAQAEQEKQPEAAKPEQKTDAPKPEQAAGEQKNSGGQKAPTDAAERDAKQPATTRRS